MAAGSGAAGKARSAWGESGLPGWKKTWTKTSKPGEGSLDPPHAPPHALPRPKTKNHAGILQSGFGATLVSICSSPFLWLCVTLDVRGSCGSWWGEALCRVPRSGARALPKVGPRQSRACTRYHADELAARNSCIFSTTEASFVK